MDIRCLAADALPALPDELVKTNTSLLPIGKYLFSEVSGNRYLSGGSNGIMLSVTIADNASAAK